MEDVKSLGKILGLWAHPDDETFSSGGLVSMAHKNGQMVGCITATRGELGVYNPAKWPAEEIAQIRTEELAEAQQILGIDEHYWLDYTDGDCSKVPDSDALEKIVPIIEKFQPDTIVTFSPNGITGHEDHKTVGRWASLAVRQIGGNITILQSVIAQESYEKYLRKMDEELNIFFNLDVLQAYTEEDCSLYLRLDDETALNKCNALKAMPSQTEGMINKFSFEYICQAFNVEAFINDSQDT